MRSSTVLAITALAALLACSGGQSGSSEATGADSGPGAPGDAGGVDAAPGDDAGGAVDATSPDTGGAVDAGGDAADANACEWGGAPGECITVSACSAMADHTPYAGQCPGPATIQCCIVTPSTANNPPFPAGWVPMQDSQVTPPMTTWAVAILNHPTTYPMFSTTTMTFGAMLVLARVEWHPPDFQNGVVHRGVTLYEQAD